MKYDWIEETVIYWTVTKRHVVNPNQHFFSPQKFDKNTFDLPLAILAIRERVVQPVHLQSSVSITCGHNSCPVVPVPSQMTGYPSLMIMLAACTLALATAQGVC